jgi:3-oxoacyl-[acyl-carrier-protein] synthase-1
MAYLTGDNIITSLGLDTVEVLDKIEKGITGITNKELYRHFTKAPVSLIDYEKVQDELSVIFPETSFTHFESISTLSIHKALIKSNINTNSDRTLFILSTTKGNIDLLHSAEEPGKNIMLYPTAVKISQLFGFSNSPVVVCNACISGVMALILANRYIDSGMYDHVVVTGADVVSEFIVAGFESFKSMSEKPCKPFDVSRDGLSLGEGAATIIVSNEPQTSGIKIIRGATANDANHISGPSRTGEGLYLATKNTLSGTGNIDFISAHGTATPYNDDMESIALDRLYLSSVPVNSFKGYFGHTLGAAGVIETVLTKHSMLRNKIYGTMGNESDGVVAPINVIREHTKKELNRCLKLTSGFGGCNASILLEKYDR